MVSVDASAKRAGSAAGDATPDGRPTVSVLVPVLDEARHIRQTVDAMLAQRVDGTAEFLFADGGSTDGTREILEELAARHERIRVLDNPRRRTPSGLNVCLREARGTFVARMDAHTFYPTSYLADGIRRLEQGGTDWVSGPAVAEPVGAVSSAVATALSTWLGRGGSRKWDPAAGEVELDTGVFAGVWRRETILAYGGWDEAWPANQDSEMAGRFLADGRRLVCLPSMAARYIPRDTLGGLFRQYRRYGVYRIRTAKRHPHSLRRSHILAPALLASTVVALGAPRPLRGLARAGLAVYGTTVLTVSLSASRGRPFRVRAVLPFVFLAMHAGNGEGFLEGVLRFGPPWAAVARLLGARVEPRNGHDLVVFAPSLRKP